MFAIAKQVETGCKDNVLRVPQFMLVMATSAVGLNKCDFTPCDIGVFIPCDIFPFLGPPRL